MGMPFEHICGQIRAFRFQTWLFGLMELPFEHIGGQIREDNRNMPNSPVDFFLVGNLRDKLDAENWSEIWSKERHVRSFRQIYHGLFEIRELPQPDWTKKLPQPDWTKKLAPVGRVL